MAVFRAIIPASPGDFSKRRRPNVIDGKMRRISWRERELARAAANGTAGGRGPVQSVVPRHEVRATWPIAVAKES